MKFLYSVAALIVLALNPTATGANDLVVFSAGAVKPALSVLAPMWEARSGQRLQIIYATAGDLRRNLAAGERADLVILPLENFAAVEAAGLTRAASRRDLGAVGIGVAVKAGARLPDLSSEDGLKRALLDARSVAFMDPARGTSGKYIDEVVLPKLAIRDLVRAKAVLGEGGMIAEKVARGEVEIAFQQMTELLPVAGIAIAGVLPPSLQKTTVYSAAVMTSAKSPAEAAALLEFLVSRDGRPVFLAKGFSAP
jgi:molybdate transport system substrate-binding protein